MDRRMGLRRKSIEGENVNMMTKWVTKNKPCSKKEDDKCSLTYIYQVRFSYPTGLLGTGFPLKAEGIKATIATLQRDANPQL